MVAGTVQRRDKRGEKIRGTIGGENGLPRTHPAAIYVSLTWQWHSPQSLLSRGSSRLKRIQSVAALSHSPRATIIRVIYCIEAWYLTVNLIQLYTSSTEKLLAIFARILQPSFEHIYDWIRLYLSRASVTSANLLWT